MKREYWYELISIVVHQYMFCYRLLFLETAVKIIAYTVINVRPALT